MSLVPMLHEPTDTWDLDRRMMNRFWDWDFDWDWGSAFAPHWDIPRKRLLRNFGSLSELSQPIIGKDGLQVSINVQQFKSYEITVKTSGDYVIVEGKHKERPDGHGFISRHFIRRYLLPKGYDPKDVISTLSSDGILTIKAPPPYKPLSYIKERFLPIKHTGPSENRLKTAKY